jgi:hypothetical protein
MSNSSVDSFSNNNSSSIHRSFFSDNRDDDDLDDDDFDNGGLLNDRYYQHNDSFSIAAEYKKNHDKQKQQQQHQLSLGKSQDRTNKVTKMTGRIRRLFHFGGKGKNTIDNNQKNDNEATDILVGPVIHIVKNSDRERQSRSLGNSNLDRSTTITNATETKKKSLLIQSSKVRNQLTSTTAMRYRQGSNNKNTALDLRHVTTLGSADSTDDNDEAIATPASVTTDLLGKHFNSADCDDQDSSTGMISTSSSTLLQMHILEQQKLKQLDETNVEAPVEHKLPELNNKVTIDTTIGNSRSLLHDEGRQQQLRQQNEYQSDVDEEDDESDQDDDDDNRNTALPLPIQLHQQTKESNVGSNGKRSSGNTKSSRKNKFLRPPVRNREKSKVRVDPPATGNNSTSTGDRVGVDADAPLLSEIQVTNNTIDSPTPEPPCTNLNSLATEKICNRAFSTTPSLGIANANSFQQFTKDNLEVLNKQHKERQVILNHHLQSLLNDTKTTATTTDKKASPISSSSDSSLFSSLDDDVKNRLISEKPDVENEIRNDIPKEDRVDECVEVLAVSNGNGMGIKATTVAMSTAHKKMKNKLKSRSLSSNYHPQNNNQANKDVIGARILQTIDYDTETDSEDNPNKMSAIRKGAQTDKAVLATMIKSGLTRPFGRSTVLEMLNTYKMINVTVKTPEWNQDKQKWMYTVSVHRRTNNCKSPNKDRSPVSSPSSSYLTATCTRSVSDFIWLERALRYEFHGALLIPPLVVLSQSDNNPSQMPVESDVLKDWLSDAFNGIRGSGEVILPYSGVITKEKTNQEKGQLRKDGLLNHQEEKKEEQAVLLPTDSGDNSLVDQIEYGGAFFHYDIFMQSESIETFLYRKSDSLDDVDIYARFGILGTTTTTAAGMMNDKCYNNNNCNNLENAGLFLGCNASNVDMDENDQREPTLLQTMIGRAAMLNPLDLCIGPSPLNPTVSMDQQYDMVKDDIPKEVMHPKTKYSRQQHKEHNQQATTQMDDSNRNSIFSNRGLPLDVMACSSRVIGIATSVDVQDSLVDFAPSTVSSLTSMNHGNGVIAADDRKGRNRDRKIVEASSVNLSPAQSSEIAVHSELIEAGKDLMMNYRQTALRVVEKLNALEVEEEKVGACWKRLSTSLSALFAYEKEVEHTKFGSTLDGGSGKVTRDKMPYRKISKSSVDDALRVMARQKVDRSLIPLRTLKEMLAAYLNDLNTIAPSVDVYTTAMQRFVATGYRQKNNKCGDPCNFSHLRNCNAEEPIGWVALAATAIDGVKLQALRSFGQGIIPPSTRHDQCTNDRAQSGIPWEQEADERSKLLVHETILRQSVTTMCRATPFRLSRMIWHYWNAECVQCTMQQSASSMLRTKVDCISQESIAYMLRRHVKEEKDDNLLELDLLKKLIGIGSSSNKLNPDTMGKDATKGILTDTQYYSAERSKEMLRDKALEIGKQRLGRWNSTLTYAIMEAIEMKNCKLEVDGNTKELKMVRKYADGLRENLDRCKECVKLLTETMTGSFTNPGYQRADEGVEVNCDAAGEPKTHETMKGIQERRTDFFNEFRKLLSAAFIHDHEQHQPPRKRSSASKVVLLQAGIDITDPVSWAPSNSTNIPSSRRAEGNAPALNMTNTASKYMEMKDAQIPWLLSSLHGLIDEYYQRIDVIEGYIYMELMGNQIERHFSDKRASALALFEKKTDITSAMNVASRKRLPKLIAELQGKLAALGPEVSQSAVREAKEAHLESKNIKASLHNVATRRLNRARECSTERIVQLLSFWAKEEENAIKDELQVVRSSVSKLESVVAPDLTQLEACGIISY